MLAHESKEHRSLIEISGFFIAKIPTAAKYAVVQNIALPEYEQNNISRGRLVRPLLQAQKRLPK